MPEKKPFSDKRWNQPLGGIVVGHAEVTEEDKKLVEDFKKKRNSKDKK